MLAPSRRARPIDTLVLEHTGLVRRIAHGFARRAPGCMDVDDLVQNGMVGLLEAAQRYQESKSASFSTFAISRIRGAIIDACRRADWSSRLMRRRFKTIEGTKRRLERQAGTTATPAMIAKELAISLDLYFQVMRDRSAAVQMSLCEPLPASVGRENPEPSDSAKGPDEEAERQDILRAISVAIDSLTENERVIFMLYYDRELPMREIGSMLALSESRICQIHKRAIERIRAATQN